MNRRAFNLFTALVSFILIILSGLLVGTMIQAENSTKDILVGMEEQARIEAVAEIVRTDAVQLFNFAIRRQIEEYFTSENEIEFTLEALEDWETLKQEFRSTYFSRTGHTEPFADNAASYLEALYKGFGFTYSTYEIKLVDVDRGELKEAIIEMGNKAEEEAGGFFKVIECDHGNLNTCEKGTFYVTLAVKDMAEAEDTAHHYENLPIIVVRDLATGRIVQNPVLPRKNIQIYVPLRIFKAFAAAREVATEMRGDLHNRIDDWGLGVCDLGSCRPRYALQAETPGNLNDKMCVGDPKNSAAFGVQDSSAVHELIPISGQNYSPLYGPVARESKKEALEGLVRELVSVELVGLFGPYATTDFVPRLDSDRIRVGTHTKESAQILQSGHSTPVTGSGQSFECNPNPNPSPLETDSCFEECEIVRRVEIPIQVVERNRQYMVVDSTEKTFRIKIVDGYAVQEEPWNEWNRGDWRCQSHLEQDLSPSLMGGTPVITDYAGSCNLT